MKHWFVYIVRCNDGSLYTGIATDVARRVDEHNQNNRLSAKYTKARRPVSLVHQETFDSRSAATKREIQVKKMRKAKKEGLLNLN